jgi:hypothetical protein
MTGVRLAVVTLGLCGTALSCGRSATKPADESPHLEAAWTGKALKTGKLMGPASAEWCDTLRLLQVQATRGDTGIAIALYPLHTELAGSFPVVPPARADSVRPSAAVALRWFGETTVRGFQGDSGSVLLSRTASGKLSGRFSTGARSVSDGSRINVRGTFRGLVMHRASVGCVPRRKAAGADTGVH